MTNATRYKLINQILEANGTVNSRPDYLMEELGMVAAAKAYRETEIGEAYFQAIRELKTERANLLAGGLND